MARIIIMCKLFISFFICLTPVDMKAQNDKNMYKMFNFLVSEGELSLKDTGSQFITKIDIVELPMIDTCKMIAFYKFKARGVHSRVYFAIIDGDSAYFETPKHLPILIQKVNNYFLGYPCAVKDERRIVIFQAIINAAKRRF